MHGVGVHTVSGQESQKRVGPSLRIVVSTTRQRRWIATAASATVNILRRVNHSEEPEVSTVRPGGEAPCMGDLGLVSALRWIFTACGEMTSLPAEEGGARLGRVPAAAG